MKHHRKTYFALFLLLALLASCGGKQMRQRLEFVADCNRTDTVFTAQWKPTVDSLVKYFRRHGTANERMMAYYLQGRVHHDLGEAPQALDAYQRATEQADTTRDDCDLHTLTAIYGQMANLFEAQYLPDNEMKALQTAEQIAWKDRDTLTSLIVFYLRARPYYLKDEKDSVMFVEKQARERYLKYGYKEEAAQAMLGTISILLDRELIQEAKHYLDIFEQESGWFDSEGNIMKGKELCYYDKGRYLMATGQVDSALFYFHKTVAGNKEAAYHGLLSVYERKNTPDSIAKYAKLFAAANDSNFLHVNQEKVHQITAMYDYSHHQRVAEENKAKASRFMLYSLFLLFTIVAGALFFAYVYNRKRMKSRLQLSQLLNTKNELQALLDETQGQIDAIQEEHHQALALHLDEKRALQTELDKLNESLRRTSVSKLKDAFSETEISKRFKEIKDRRPLLKSPTALEWNMFQKTFKEYFPNYMAFIEQDHTLTKEHLRICMLLPMDFKEGDMAFFLDVNGQRIDRLKSQINHKFFNDSKSSTLRRHLKTQFYGGVDSV
ncbi:MAG: hypothetical protein II934_01840 [Prevotella sp.]|nr:hypothetical protein [Prevotella sp.]